MGKAKTETTKRELARIAFEDETGGVETMWATPRGNGFYVLRNTPFFQYGVSFGDTVEAHWRAEDLEASAPGKKTPNGFPYFAAVVEKGGHGTLRVALETDHDAPARSLLSKLSRLGCSYEGFPPKLVAIDVPALCSLDAVMGALVASGYEWENGDPPEEEVPGRISYVIDPTGGMESTTDRLGRSAVGGGAGPACAGCGARQRRVLALAAHESRLRLSCSEGVSLAVCASCRGQGSVTFEPPLPSSGETQVLVYRRTEEANVWAQELPEVWPGNFVDKVGGYPRWARADETPSCGHCAVPMCLVAQLGPATLEHVVGRRTVGYVFVCPHEHEGAFVEQEAPG